MDDSDEVALRRRHTWDPKTGNCGCGWEPSEDRGAERQHARHLDRVLEGKLR